jgi:hypothetical protein
MFYDDGTINFKLLQRHSQRDIEGVIFYDIKNIDKSQYIPIIYLPKSCVEKVVLSHKHTPIDRLWISLEDCQNYNTIQCINSQSCTIGSVKKGCTNNVKYQLLKLQQLNNVMLPYKYYTFSEYETSLYNTDIQHVNHFKPNGLWFGQGDEWLQHMKKTNFRMNRYNYLYELELNMDEILLISTVKDLYNFSERFCTSKSKRHETSFCFAINWDKVISKTNKSGIVISPNLKKIIKKYKDNYLDYFEGMEWYLTWDVASGVVWNTKAVKSMRLIYKRQQGSFIKSN